MGKAEPFFELDSTDLSGVLPVVTIVCCIVCLLAVTAKLLYQSSFLSLRHFDYALLAGTVLVVAQSCIAVSIANLGLGKHEVDVDTRSLDKIRKVILGQSTCNLYCSGGPGAVLTKFTTSYNMHHRYSESLSLSAPKSLCAFWSGLSTRTAE